jgi:bacterioferritin-associated ferredoxin
MIVCLCRGVSDRAIRAAIEAGADTPRKLAAAVGAGTDCGSCCMLVRELLKESGRCAFQPAPSPYVVASGEPP